MPPSYITVETSYDCLPSHSKAENMELHNYSISRKVCETSSLYKSVLQVINKCKIKLQNNLYHVWNCYFYLSEEKNSLCIPSFQHQYCQGALFLNVDNSFWSICLQDDNLQELMKQNIFQKLTVMRKTNSKLTLPNCNYQMLKVNASSRANISELFAKNIKGICIMLP